jgi:hypothetical protein
MRFWRCWAAAHSRLLSLTGAAFQAFLIVGGYQLYSGLSGDLSCAEAHTSLGFRNRLSAV